MFRIIVKFVRNTKFNLTFYLRKIILKREYKRKYGTNKVFKRLMNCSYDFNFNNYVFLKPPFEKREIPCDYKIANLIEFLWKENIITFGSNQPNDTKKEIGYITFSVFTSKGNCSFPLMKKLVGTENLMFYSRNIFI
jgi:16S rRNA G966 N2-methylase RsmD